MQREGRGGMRNKTAGRGGGGGGGGGCFRVEGSFESCASRTAVQQHYRCWSLARLSAEEFREHKSGSRYFRSRGKGATSLNPRPLHLTVSR